MKKSIIAKILILVLLILPTYNYAQRVTASLNVNEYDIAYLTDFVDIRSQQLNPNIQGLSLSLIVNGEPQSLWVCVYVELWIQLRGEANEKLMHAFTNNFKIDGSRVLAANNFAKGGSSEIFIREGSDSYWENKTLRKKLENIASKNPTAPPGKYTVIMKVLKATSTDPNDRRLPNVNDVLGGDSKTITVQFSTENEAFVEIVEPRNGAFFNNLSPTFNWTANTQKVKVSVYEVGTNHRSPQDALTGSSPCLVQEVVGATSLTYPTNAQRSLRQNTAYVLQVTAQIVSNRGTIERASDPVVFRITDDRVGQMLDNFLNKFSSIAVPYNTLRSEPNNWIAWTSYGNITLDGNTISETELQTILNELAGKTDIELQLSIENQ